MKKILFHDEVRTKEELINKITSLADAPELNDVKIGVICFIFDKDGKVVLNRRGAGARDDIGKLQALGGSINDSDPDDFRQSMMRELKEEAGVTDTSIDSFWYIWELHIWNTDGVNEINERTTYQRY